MQFADLRIVVPLPAQAEFGGFAVAMARPKAQALEDLGATVELVTSEEWGDRRRRPQVLSRLREFGANCAIAPQAGYGLSFRGDRDENLFTDILGLPTLLPWDHMLTQAPNYFLRERMYISPQQPGAIEAIRTGLSSPLFKHYVQDSGHIKVYEDLGLLGAGRAGSYSGTAAREHIEVGAAGPPASAKTRVAFGGNVYAAMTAKLPSLQNELVRQVETALIAAKLQRWSSSSWDLFRAVLESLPEDFRLKNGLTTDFPLFWRLADELLSYSVSTAMRLGVLRAIEQPIDFFGNFNDPESTASLPDHIRFCGTAEYLHELPKVYRSYDIWVDVANAAFINGYGGKFYGCFAAGSFMLVDYHQDIRADLGDIAEKITYRDVDELKEKLTYYQSHSSERREIVAAMQEIIRERITIKQQCEQFCVRMAAEVQTSSPGSIPAGGARPR